ncbi:bifunctional folylpolyglutamate synthase/dihydrofolate synthase [Mucilaginibacter sp. JRF]|uniref:bifunctional folylpolyglutamate synthase/dihydrofolate synthase n=1 Tax=Mucilaginibacter sp. JRF TaxID=2780088 RepID=UPI001881846C|nr:folylpolyglutamate synthase/dihydrofolate synthase family protein [Mucilaginibacter sp. JRF]MBE9584170.1 bifunctional folylpolyglutamate synthase/dihydrofolate synthase [Mucilaginibacter sp. JRF]
MTYAETLDYLFSQLPMFTRIGASAIKNNLDNTIALCQLLGDPHKKFKSIHIAGTNGKGSTSHMLAAILQTAGYKTGLYTSPHLKDFRERIRVNGQMIPEQTVVDFVEYYKADFERIQPSFFEMTVALAFDVFVKENIDIAIVEVGLGGRLDSTNVITPLLSLITNIGWDHMNMLGNTLPEIAGEKAGIIKPNIPVIISERQDEVADVFIKKAQELNAHITFAADVWQVEVTGQQDDALIHKNITANNGSQTYQLDIDLTGTYQQKNIKGVLQAVEQLRTQGFIITDEHVQQALRQVKVLTGLHGRWEVLSTSPLTICDTGHNPDGVEEVLKNIATVKYRQLHFVIGMVNDKDISKVLAMLPKDANYYFCKPDIPRGLAAEDLQVMANGFGLTGDTYPSVTSALNAAQIAAGANDLVFAGGSTFVVAEIVK